MKTIHIVKNRQGEELFRGSLLDVQEKFNLTDRDVYSIIKATKMGIEIYTEKIETKKALTDPKKVPDIVDYLKRHLTMYDSTVLGDLPVKKVSKALEDLEDIYGIEATASYNTRNKGWTIERVKE